MTNMQMFYTIVAITLATMLTRFLPFFMFPANKTTPPSIKFLGEVLPFAVIGLLVVYCLRDTSFQNFSGWLPQTIAVLSIVILHRWKHNTLLSISVSTLLYMFLIQYIF